MGRTGNERHIGKGSSHVQKPLRPCLRARFRRSGVDSVSRASRYHLLCGRPALMSFLVFDHWRQAPPLLEKHLHPAALGQA